LLKHVKKSFKKVKKTLKMLKKTLKQFLKNKTMKNFLIWT